MRTRNLAPWLFVFLSFACTNDYDVFKSTGEADAGAAGGAAGSGGTAGTSGKAGSSGQGGTSGSGGQGGSAGKGGTAGAAGQGGDAGAAGTAGAAGGGGSAGTAGAAGAAGAGGSAGAAGAAGSGGTIVTVEVRVQNGGDDVEQRTTDGAMYLDSTDLELGDDTAYYGEQAIGLRFPGVVIPQGATIASAYIEFEVDEATNEATSVQIQAQAADDAPAFDNSAWNLTSRPTTTQSVAWSSIPAWNNPNAKIQTPDLATVVAAIVNRAGWTSPSAMVFVIEGTGCRIAEAFEGEAQNAPLLHVEYVAP